MSNDIPPPVTVAENCLETAWDTPDDRARVHLEQAHGVILTLIRRMRRHIRLFREQRLHLQERCVTLARALERVEAELECYKSRDAGAGL